MTVYGTRKRYGEALRFDCPKARCGAKANEVCRSAHPRKTGKQYPVNVHRERRLLCNVVHIDELKSAPDKVMRAARRSGGVRVVDSAGVEQFRLSISGRALRD